jgi:hypothetical protein
MPRDRGVPRREFMKTAVAIGGASALAACAQRRGEDPDSGTETPAFPQGQSDPDAGDRPEHQHDWGQYLVTDMGGNVVFPRHQVFVFLDYLGDGPPTDAERERVETAFRTLERAFQWGTGGDPTAVLNSGLLFTIGYAPSYFERFDAGAPAGVDLPTAARTLRDLDDDPAKADPYDAVLHLASDHAEVVIGAEEALFGGIDRVNGVAVEGSLADVFERAERRPGFVGRGLPHEEIDERIPEQSPISMGFKSAFRDTLPSESAMTLPEGPFAGSTLQHVSRLEIDVDAWYDVDHADRVELMFSPEHTEEEVGEVGDSLPKGESGMTEETAEATCPHARERGRVGHGQKLARARDDDFEAVILRRGDFNGTDGATTTLNFGSIQRDMADFVRTRRAMDDLGFEEDEEPPEIDEAENGILGFTEVTNRANFLMPPRALRSLPPARP